MITVAISFDLASYATVSPVAEIRGKEIFTKGLFATQRDFSVVVYISISNLNSPNSNLI